MAAAVPVLVVGGREWECRPLLPARLAREALKLSARWDHLDRRKRRRRANRLFAQIMRTQVVEYAQLVVFLNAQPHLWDHLVEVEVPRLIGAYEAANRVESAGVS